MAAGHDQGALAVPCPREGSPQAQTFGHGAAGTIQPGEGHAQPSHGVSTGGTLSLQVSRKSQGDPVGGNTRLAQAEFGTFCLQQGLGVFPAGTILGPEGGILHQQVKPGSERPLPFPFASHRRPGGNDRRLFKYQGIFPADGHGTHPPLLMAQYSTPHTQLARVP